jgi:hypothetical protein
MFSRAFSSYKSEVFFQRRVLVFPLTERFFSKGPPLSPLFSLSFQYQFHSVNVNLLREAST